MSSQQKIIIFPFSAGNPSVFCVSSLNKLFWVWGVQLPAGLNHFSPFRRVFHPKVSDWALWGALSDAAIPAAWFVIPWPHVCREDRGAQPWNCFLECNSTVAFIEDSFCQSWARLEQIIETSSITLRLIQCCAQGCAVHSWNKWNRVSTLVYGNL